MRNPLEVTLLPEVDPPRELVPIVNAIDFLFARMQRALSIVLLVVEMHGAKIQLLDSPLGGLRVQVTLPRHSEAQP